MTQQPPTSAEAGAPIGSTPGKRARFLRKRFLIPLLAILALIALLPADRMRTLRAEVAGADEVRLICRIPTGQTPPVIRFQGKDKVAEFLNAVDLQPTQFGCLCGGWEEIQFVQNGTVLVKLNYGGNKLMWIDGRWSSDAHLTSESATRIREWFEANGGEQLIQARARATQIREDWSRQMSDEVEAMRASESQAATGHRASLPVSR